MSKDFTKFAYRDQEILGVNVSLVGNKALALGRLIAARIRVPPFFVISSAALERYLSYYGISIRNYIQPNPSTSDLEVQAGCLKKIILDSPVPDEVLVAIHELYSDLSERANGAVVAVRSSGAAEDLPTASFAGQFLSRLGVSGKESLISAVRECWSSYFGPRVAAYRKAHSLTSSLIAFAVIVQRQIFAKKAGVLFTAHPVFNSDCIYVEANFGTGESVVGGLVTPDAYSISRDGRISAIEVKRKKKMTIVSSGQGSMVIDTDPEIRDAQCLTETELRQLADSALLVERLFGQPQDIEWAIDSEGYWILQARPITERKADLI